MSGGTFAARLPMPPSANNLFATFTPKGGGKQRRVISAEYKAWKKAAGIILLAQWRLAGKPRITAPYEVHIQLNLNHQSDIANREKAITDLLVQTIPDFPGDQWVNRMLIERNRDMEAPAIVRVDSVVTVNP